MGDVTNRELENRLIDLSDGIREDMGELRATLATLMPREVYEARHEALRDTVARQDARHTAELLELKTSLQQEKDARRSLAKWTVGVIVVPVVLFIGQIVINAQGVAG